PGLLAHLGDDRPTRLVLFRSGFPIGGMVVDRDAGEPAEVSLRLRRERPERSYRVRVGDLCYVAVGQIVNRGYQGANPQPTNMLFVTCLPSSKRLREGLVRAWADLTPERHRASLARDLQSGDEVARNGAALRLAYYYPAALEQLARPTYPEWEVYELLRNRL